MNKLEYSDLYKFLVSLGIVLIGLALVVPWLFLRESFDIFVTVSEIANLTVTAQTLLIHRQKVALWFIRNVWWISILLSVFGFTSLGYGIGFWIRKQRLIDQRDEFEVDKTGLELAKLKQEMESLTPAEIAMEGIKEIEDAFEPDTSVLEGSIPAFESRVQKYLHVEQIFLNKLIACYGDERVLVQHRSKQEIYDAVLIANNTETKDILFEIKSFTKNLSLERVRKVTTQVCHLIQNYAVVKGQVTKSIAGVILFVTEENELNNSRNDRYLWEINDLAKSFGVRVHTIFITETDLIKMTCKELQTKLNSISKI
ncbi:MAG: hypothetical protein H6667_19420 [Ardenticatenaceae bacterium]|nr:hypothetical protein [Ardenticatenaceae bacterium]MCB9446113.1 hypothetical protein [Ardenticatenaceae bacterium]